MKLNMEASILGATLDIDNRSRGIYMLNRERKREEKLRGTRHSCHTHKDKIFLRVLCRKLHGCSCLQVHESYTIQSVRS